MSGPQRARLPGGRWHFQHGPIDCIVGAEGDAVAVADAVERAWARFGGVLAELVAELPLLRIDLSSREGRCVDPRGAIARRMVAACRAQAEDGRFITAMAAVAGSVAEDLIGSFDDPRIVRAYVNNGGDIALRLAPGAAFAIGWVVDHGARAAPGAAFEIDGKIDRAIDLAPRPERVGAFVGAPRAPDGAGFDGHFRVVADSGVRGIATSGWRGRSFSLGIADSVTVLAATASGADAAATIVANAVDADDARIRRAPASRLRDDSDLGDRLVTCEVPMLATAVVASALAAGAAEAERQIRAGRVAAVAICLQGRVCTRPSAAAFDTLVPYRAVALPAIGTPLASPAPPSIRM